MTTSATNPISPEFDRQLTDEEHAARQMMANLILKSGRYNGIKCAHQLDDFFGQNWELRIDASTGQAYIYTHGTRVNEIVNWPPDDDRKQVVKSAPPPVAEELTKPQIAERVAAYHELRIDINAYNFIAAKAKEGKAAGFKVGRVQFFWNETAKEVMLYENARENARLFYGFWRIDELGATFRPIAKHPISVKCDIVGGIRAAINLSTE